jgi:hypothetical protein
LQFELNGAFHSCFDLRTKQRASPCPQLSYRELLDSRLPVRCAICASLCDIILITHAQSSSLISSNCALTDDFEDVASVSGAVVQQLVDRIDLQFRRRRPSNTGCSLPENERHRTVLFSSVKVSYCFMSLLCESSCCCCCSLAFFLLDGSQS